MEKYAAVTLPSLSDSSYGSLNGLCPSIYVGNIVRLIHAELLVSIMLSINSNNVMQTYIPKIILLLLAYLVAIALHKAAN